MAPSAFSLFGPVLQSVADLLYLVKGFTAVSNEGVQPSQALAIGSGRSFIDLSATITAKQQAKKSGLARKI